MEDNGDRTGVLLSAEANTYKDNSHTNETKLCRTCEMVIAPA